LPLIERPGRPKGSLEVGSEAAGAFNGSTGPAEVRSGSAAEGPAPRSSAGVAGLGGEGVPVEAAGLGGDEAPVGVVDPDAEESTVRAPEPADEAPVVGGDVAGTSGRSTEVGSGTFTHCPR
jgi:hypothetical protein